MSNVTNSFSLKYMPFSLNGALICIQKSFSYFRASPFREKESFAHYWVTRNAAVLPYSDGIRSRIHSVNPSENFSCDMPNWQLFTKAVTKGKLLLSIYLSIYLCIYQNFWRIDKTILFELLLKHEKLLCGQVDTFKDSRLSLYGPWLGLIATYICTGTCPLIRLLFLIVGCELSR